MSVEVGVIVCGNIAFRCGHFDKAGEACVGHKHNFDHPTIVTKGGLRIRLKDDAGKVVETQDVYAAAKRRFINIAKGRIHELEALVDDTDYLCGYPHRNEDGEIVEFYTGWEPGYS